MDNLEEFRDTIKSYCQRKPKDNAVGRERKRCGLEDLAAALGYNSTYLSNKLNGKVDIAPQDIREIARVLAQEWKVLSPQEEAALRDFADSDLVRAKNRKTKPSDQSPFASSNSSYLSPRLEATSGTPHQRVAIVHPYGSELPYLLGSSTEESIAVLEIVAELRRLSSFVKALYSRLDSKSPNVSDIAITLCEIDAPMLIQVMVLSESNLHLETMQIMNWLDSQIPIVPLWWDEERRTIYWADLSQYFFSGLLSRKVIALNRQIDLQRLDARDAVSVETFFRWASKWSTVWAKLYNQSSTIYSQSKNYWLLDLRFPVPFLEVIRHPDILPLLPLNTHLVTLLESAGNQEKDRHQIIMDIISAGTQAQSSPEHAIEKLLNQYGVIHQESRLQVAREFSYWLERIVADGEPHIAQTLRALNQLFSLLSYEKSGLLRLPPFASTYTFPLGRLVSLLPPDIVVEPLRAILAQHNDPDVLRHAAYCLGLLNIPLNDHIWKDMNKLRQKVFARRAAIGKRWTLVDRQLLYTEAQLGGGEANTQFIRALRDNDALHFELAYNFMYYGGNSQFIQRQIEHRLGEGRRTDRFVDNILQTGYNHFWKHRDNLEIFSKLDPKLWLPLSLSSK